MISVIAHKITAFVLVFILFAQNINTLVIVGEFMVNQDFIAKTLCIQKENQQGCNGKCQLRKELKENTSDSQSDAPLQESKRLSLDMFYLSGFADVNMQCVQYLLYQEELIRMTPKVIEMYIDIETPPPNFI